MKDISILTGSIFFTLAISSSGPAADPAMAPPCSPPPVQQEEKEAGEDTLRVWCRALSEDKRRIHYVNTRHNRISMQLHGIYTHGHYLFFRIRLFNHSNLDFDGDSIRFYIVDRQIFYPAEASPDKRQAGRIASPPVVRVKPLYVYGDPQKIKGRSEEETIIVLPRFTLPKRKRLVMQLVEPEGGRNLLLHIGNYPLLSAIPI